MFLFVFLFAFAFILFLLLFLLALALLIAYLAILFGWVLVNHLSLTFSVHFLDFLCFFGCFFINHLIIREHFTLKYQSSFIFAFTLGLLIVNMQIFQHILVQFKFTNIIEENLSFSIEYLLFILKYKIFSKLFSILGRFHFTFHGKLPNIFTFTKLLYFSRS